MRQTICFLFFVVSVYSSLCQGVANWIVGNPHISRTDAAYAFNDEYIALISNKSILYMPISGSPELKPITATLSSNLFPAEYNSRPISDAISFDNSTVLLFKGNVYRPVNKEDLTPKGDVAIWTGWPGIWNNDIDAALEWSDGSYVFIKGLQYVSYDPLTGKTSNTSQLNLLPGWPNSWSGSIDAAFNGGDGFLYFIRKGEILAMNAQSKMFAPGYPRSLAGSKNGNLMNKPGVNQFAQQQNNPASAFETVNNSNYDPNGVWCAVGTPDPTRTSATGSIKPGISVFAGGNGGKEFKDILPAGTRVAEVRVWGSWNISAIELVTESKEGFITESGKHGSTLGTPKVFKLVPGECITGIEGTWGGTANKTIYTLRIITNSRKSQEFGGMGGQRGEYSFSSIVPPESSFAGFAGRASDNLDAIGIQYYTIQYLFVDAEGKIIEGTGDKKDWTAIQDEVKKPAGAEEKADSLIDPYDDNLTDVSDLSDMERHNLLGEMWNYRIMPNVEWVGYAVDFTKIDPFDITATEPVDLPKNSPIYITPGPVIGGPTNDWFIVNGANKQRSTSISSGRSTEKIQILNTYNSYAREFGIQVGGHFDVVGTAAGALNFGHTERKTETIGRERVMISKTVEIKSHNIAFDLFWHKSGKKYRQLLNSEFRKEIEALPVPPGTIASMPTNQMKKNGVLPSNITRYQKEYQALINKWGTHFMNEIVFGGYYTMWMMMTKEEIQRSQMTLDEIEARFDGMVVGGKAAGQTKTETASGTSKTESGIEISATGGYGITNFNDWSNAVAKEPRPQSYKLFSHADLLIPEFFPFDPDISKKQKLFDIFIRQYLVNNDKPPIHDRDIAINFFSKEQKANAQAEQKVRLKVEFLRMKIDQEDGVGEDPSTQELFGTLSYALVGKNDVKINSGTIWNFSKSNKQIFNVKSWKELQTKPFNVVLTKAEKSNTKLVVYGNVTDYDTWFGKIASDEICNYRSVADGVETDLEVINTEGASREIDIPLSGTLTIKVRISWLKN